VGTIGECAEVDGEWAVSGVEFAESADADEGAGGNDGEVGLSGELMDALEFGRSDELEAQMRGAFGGAGR